MSSGQQQVSHRLNCTQYPPHSKTRQSQQLPHFKQKNGLGWEVLHTSKNKSEAQNCTQPLPLQSETSFHERPQKNQIKVLKNGNQKIRILFAIYIYIYTLQEKYFFFKFSLCAVKNQGGKIGNQLIFWSIACWTCKPSPPLSHMVASVLFSYLIAYFVDCIIRSFCQNSSFFCINAKKPGFENFLLKMISPVRLCFAIFTK